MTTLENATMMKPSYFEKYENLAFTRDDDGVLVLRFHTNGGPIVFTGSGVQYHTVSGDVTAEAVDPHDPSGNIIYVGSDNGGRTAALLRSFIASCKRAGVEPFAWFRDVLSRIAAHPITRLTELLPHNWKSIASPAQA